MAGPERVRRAGGLALEGELTAVMLVPACPRAGPGLMIGGQDLAGPGEADTRIYLRLRQAGQLRAQRAHRRTSGPDHDVVPANPPTGGPDPRLPCRSR